MISPIQIRNEAEQLKDQLVTIRRDLHAHPELAFQEVRTAGVVANKLNALGYEVQTGVGKTGVVGLLEGTKPGNGKTVLLRFDMDALPIQEAVDVPYKSKNDGVMHACGHDAHTSIGLGVAELLAKHRDAWSGTAKFVFQPAEEVVGGALAMIKDGVLDGPKPDHSLSLHVWSMDEVGRIEMRDGATMAAADGFKIAVRGRGTHGAAPHMGADPIVAAAQIVLALQTIVSRNVDPLDQAVVTVGYIRGGSAQNIVPDVVELGGTTRAFKDELITFMRERIRTVVESTAKALGVEADVAFPEHFNPATVNNSAVAQVVRDSAVELFGNQLVSSDHQTMGAEDCSHFLRAAPGAYVFVGAGNKAKGITEPHHSPRFQIDEDCLPIATALMTTSAMRVLGNGE
jgi:amidohydrolase